MRNKWGTRVIFLIGFALCCRPIMWNVIEQRHQSDAVATYQNAVNKKDDTKLQEIMDNAATYNDMLYQTGGAIVDNSDTEILSDESYQEQLNVSGNGTMGSLDIPKINVELPIYHGTDDSALSNGIGHLQGTSLPVGGENTHCVLTGHRGLPSSKLLIRLDEMKKGDLFFIRTGNETLAYKVSRIQIVEPEDVSSLQIEAGEDLVTLVTCTPYGINTHRLLVTGKRVEYKKVQHDAIKQEIPSIRELIFFILPFMFAAISLGLYFWNRRETYEDGKI